MNVSENVGDIKMDLYDISRKCLGHEGTLNLLENWREILRERQVRDDDEISQHTITVSVGPQFEGKNFQNSRIIIFLCEKRNFKF